MTNQQSTADLNADLVDVEIYWPKGTDEQLPWTKDPNWQPPADWAVD